MARFYQNLDSWFFFEVWLIIGINCDFVERIPRTRLMTWSITKEMILFFCSKSCTPNFVQSSRLTCGMATRNHLDLLIGLGYRFETSEIRVEPAPFFFRVRANFCQNWLNQIILRIWFWSLGFISGRIFGSNARNLKNTFHRELIFFSFDGA